MKMIKVCNQCLQEFYQKTQYPFSIGQRLVIVDEMSDDCAFHPDGRFSIETARKLVV